MKKNLIAKILANKPVSSLIADQDIIDAESILQQIECFDQQGLLQPSHRLLVQILSVYYKAKHRKSEASIDSRVRRICEALDAITAADPSRLRAWKGPFHKRLQSLTYYLIKSHSVLSFTPSRPKSNGLHFVLNPVMYVSCLRSEVVVSDAAMLEIIRQHRSRTGEIPITRLLHHYERTFGIFSIRSFFEVLARLSSSGVLRQVEVGKNKLIFSVDVYLTKISYTDYTQHQKQISKLSAELGESVYRALPKEIQESLLSYTSAELAEFAELCVAPFHQRS